MASSQRSGASHAALRLVDCLTDSQPSKPPGDPTARDIGDRLVRDEAHRPGVRPDPR